MKLFGGKHGELFNNYVIQLQRGIGIQLEHQIKGGADEETAKAEVKKMFHIKEFKFDLPNSKITDTQSDQIKTIDFGGKRKEILTKRYEYKIPFEGDQTLMQFRPETFYGSDREGDVRNISKDEKMLIVDFRSEQNNQGHFEHEKSESIGELIQNSNEINKAIKKWNEIDLEKTINFIYPKVVEHLNKTDDFNKRNGIN